MTVGIIGIDHPVVAVKDMAEAHERYRRLGFTIPPRGSHLEWGTGNWCIMFADDYLELRGIVDSSRYVHGLDRFLERREGLMGIAFQPEAAETTYLKARAAGIDATPPRELTRRFELPEGEVHPRFRLVFFPEHQTAGLMASLVCEHLTPELIRRPEWLTHANGALGVAEVGAVVTDLGPVQAQQEKLFGAGAVRRRSDRLLVEVGRGARVEFLTQAAARQESLAVGEVEPPYLAWITIRVARLAAAASVLQRNGVAFRQDGGAVIRIAPEDACGTILRFAQ